MMNLNKFKLSFETEDLVVDWISFKFQKLEESKKLKLVNYFFNLGFNSFQESAKLAKPVKESILFISKNNFEILFINYSPYWEGTIVQFSGKNAAQLYNLAKKNLIDWQFFSSANLNRFDFYYSLNTQILEQSSVQQFLQDSFTKLQQTNKKIALEKNSNGWILKIGSRRSHYYSRIYEGPNFLKFEHEMKGKPLQNYHNLLVQNHFEQFEEELSFHFINYFGKILFLESSCTDWLVINLRKITKKKIFSSSSILRTDYIESNNFSRITDRQTFLNFLQFLTYVQTLNYTNDSLGSTFYRQVNFKVKDFLKYQKKSNNYYQLKKLLSFLDQLQMNSLIKFFSNKRYRSLVTIPEVQLIKNRHNIWIAKVWIAEELFFYVHPFLYPDFFQKKITK